jgi:hypothetical protein
MSAKTCTQDEDGELQGSGMMADLAGDGLSRHWPEGSYRGRVVATFDHEGRAYAIRALTDEERRGGPLSICLVDASSGKALTHWNPTDFCARHAVELAAEARLLEHAGRVIVRNMKAGA